MGPLGLVQLDLGWKEKKRSESCTKLRKDDCFVGFFPSSFPGRTVGTGAAESVSVSATSMPCSAREGDEVAAAAAVATAVAEAVVVGRGSSAISSSSSSRSRAMLGGTAGLASAAAAAAAAAVTARFSELGCETTMEGATMAGSRPAELATGLLLFCQCLAPSSPSSESATAPSSSSLMEVPATMRRLLVGDRCDGDAGRASGRLPTERRYLNEAEKKRKKRAKKKKPRNEKEPKKKTTTKNKKKRKEDEKKEREERKSRSKAWLTTKHKQGGLSFLVFLAVSIFLSRIFWCFCMYWRKLASLAPLRLTTGVPGIGSPAWNTELSINSVKRRA